MTGYCCCWPMNSLGHLHAAHNLKLLKRCSKIGQQEGGETQSTGDNWRLLITIRENWNKINIVFMGEREKTRNRVVCEMSNKATVRPSVIVSCPVFSHWFHSFHFDVGCWQPKHTTNQAIAAGEERIEDEGWWWGLAMRKINIGERFFLVQCFFSFKTWQSQNRPVGKPQLLFGALILLDRSSSSWSSSHREKC